MKNFGRVIFKIIGGIFTILIVFLTVFFGAFIARTPGEEFDKLLIRLLIGMGIGIIYLIIRFFFPKLLFPSEQQILLNKKKASEKTRMIRSKRGELHSFIKKAYSYYAESFYILYGVFQTLRKYTIFTFTPVFLFVSYIISDTYYHISVMLQIIILIVFLPFYIVILKYYFIVIKYVAEFVSIFIPESNTNQSTNQYTYGNTYQDYSSTPPRSKYDVAKMINDEWSRVYGGSLERAVAEDKINDINNFINDMSKKGYSFNSYLPIDFVMEITGKDIYQLMMEPVRDLTGIKNDGKLRNLIRSRQEYIRKQGLDAIRSLSYQQISEMTELTSGGWTT